MGTQESQGPVDSRGLSVGEEQKVTGGVVCEELVLEKSGRRGATMQQVMHCWYPRGAGPQHPGVELVQGEQVTFRLPPAPYCSCELFTCC